MEKQGHRPFGRRTGKLPEGGKGKAAAHRPPVNFVESNKTVVVRLRPKPLPPQPRLATAAPYRHTRSSSSLRPSAASRARVAFNRNRQIFLQVLADIAARGLDTTTMVISLVCNDVITTMKGGPPFKTNHHHPQGSNGGKGEGLQANLGLFLLSILKSWVVDPQTFIMCCDAILHIATSCEGCRRILASHRVCNLLTEHMRTSTLSSDPESLARACLCLAVALCDRISKDTVPHDQVLQVVMGALTRFPDHAGVQASACLALATLTQYQPEGKDMWSLDHASVDRVLSVINNWAHVPSVQCGALLALSAVAYSQSSERSRLGQSGLCQHLLDTLGSDEASPDLLMCALLCLGCLAHNNTDNGRALASACEVIPSILDINADNALLQACGCLAVSALSRDNASNCLTLGPSCSRSVVKAMYAFPHDLQLQEWGCMAVMSLALCQKNRTLLIHAHACEAINHFLDQQEGDDSILTANHILRYSDEATVNRLCALTLLHTYPGPHKDLVDLEATIRKLHYLPAKNIHTRQVPLQDSQLQRAWVSLPVQQRQVPEVLGSTISSFASQLALTKRQLVEERRQEEGGGYSSSGPREAGMAWLARTAPLPYRDEVIIT